MNQVSPVRVGPSLTILEGKPKRIHNGMEMENFPCAAGWGELTILVGWEIRRVMGMEAGDAGQLMNWMRCSQSHVPSTMDAARVCCGARTKATIYTIKRM